MKEFLKRWGAGLLVLAALTVQAQGVQFRPGTIGSVFEAARKARKPVFIEIYSPTCHICQSFIPTFEEAKVGSFYNRQFVSTKLDIGQKATMQFLEKNRLFIPSLPMFLYFNAQGDLIHLAMSNNSTEEVIRHGTVALTPAARSSSMESRYQKGERSANFLIDYGMYARVTRDTATNIRVMNDYVRQQAAGSFGNQTNWLVLQKLIMDVDNPLFQYLIGHLDQFVRVYGAEPVKQVAENILMSSLYSSRGNLYPAAKIMTIRNQLQQVGIDPKVAANRTLLPEINAYFRAGQGGKAAGRMEEHIAVSQFSTPEYLYVVRLFNKRSPDPADVPSVVKWINKALPLTRTPAEQADLYFELAEAYRRGGKSSDGVKAAQKSLEMAKAAKMDTRRNTEQLARLK
ncbi:DUF255 domain-containing protein [Larkinella soli]|uniref:DUF255 domain-containing protein n=1 Tax=Larkinella soli TaxID=1770527 RepID=UPI000FFC4398|nr:DUF255 domain-containing protein [Larkinella soli]